MGTNKSEDILANTTLLFAVREQGMSFKLYKTESDGFILVIKYYLLKFSFKKELLKFNTFYEAEDFILQNTSGFVNINYPRSSIF